MSKNHPKRTYRFSENWQRAKRFKEITILHRFSTDPGTLIVGKSRSVMNQYAAQDALDLIRDMVYIIYARLSPGRNIGGNLPFPSIPFHSIRLRRRLSTPPGGRERFIESPDSKLLTSRAFWGKLRDGTTVVKCRNFPRDATFYSSLSHSLHASLSFLPRHFNRARHQQRDYHWSARVAPLSVYKRNYSEREVIPSFVPTISPASIMRMLICTI